MLTTVPCDKVKRCDIPLLLVKRANEIQSDSADREKKFTPVIHRSGLRDVCRSVSLFVLVFLLHDYFRISAPSFLGSHRDLFGPCHAFCLKIKS